jgi:integrase/recombinase XerC
LRAHLHLGVFRRWLEEAGVGSPRHVTPGDLCSFQVWLARDYERRLSPGRQAYYAAVLRSFYRHLSGERLVLADPAKTLRGPKLPRRIHRDVLTPRELLSLVERPDGSVLGLRDGAALRVLAFSGLRASELVGLDCEDVNLNDREIVVRGGKGAKDRLVFFDIGTRTHLARYLEAARPALAGPEESALVVDDPGRRMSVHRLRDLVKRHASGMPKAVTPHSLRRTFCTLMLKAGANLKVIAELAGHARLSTTARYTKVDIAELSAVYRAAHPRSRT